MFLIPFLLTIATLATAVGAPLFALAKPKYRLIALRVSWGPVALVAATVGAAFSATGCGLGIVVLLYGPFVAAFAAAIACFLPRTRTVNIALAVLLIALPFAGWWFGLTCLQGGVNSCP